MSDTPNPFEENDSKGEIVEEYSDLAEDEADRLVLEELRLRGSDLSLPRHIVHHLYVDSASDRESVALAVQQHGFCVNFTNTQETQRAFLIRAERTGIADGANIKQDRVALAKIARDHDGWYDGWAAAED